MSKVRDQINELTRHLFEQHQAQKDPYRTERTTLLVKTLGKTIADEIVIAQPRSVPLAPGVHPPMGPRFIPGAQELRKIAHSKEEAHAAVERMFEVEEAPKGPAFKQEYMGTFVRGDEEDDTPSIDAPVEKRTYKRKLEP